MSTHPLREYRSPLSKLAIHLVFVTGFLIVDTADYYQLTHSPTAKTSTVSHHHSHVATRVWR
jgi:hypothetical protein